VERQMKNIDPIMAAAAAAVAIATHTLLRD